MYTMKTIETIPGLRNMKQMSSTMTTCGTAEMRSLSVAKYITYLLRGLNPQENYTDREPPLVGEVSANLYG
jgi:hypothetical protein